MLSLVGQVPAKQMPCAQGFTSVPPSYFVFSMKLPPSKLECGAGLFSPCRAQKVWRSAPLRKFDRPSKPSIFLSRTLLRRSSYHASNAGFIPKANSPSPHDQTSQWRILQRKSNRGYGVAYKAWWLRDRSEESTDICRAGGAR